MKRPLTFLFFLLSARQEVGSIIGKKGEIVKRFREEVRRDFLFSTLNCYAPVVFAVGRRRSLFARRTL